MHSPIHTHIRTPIASGSHARHQPAIWGSVSCPRTLRHVDRMSRDSNHRTTDHWMTCSTSSAHTYCYFYIYSCKYKAHATCFYPVHLWCSSLSLYEVRSIFSSTVVSNPSDLVCLSFLCCYNNLSKLWQIVESSWYHHIIVNSDLLQCHAFKFSSRDESSSCVLCIWDVLRCLELLLRPILL